MSARILVVDDDAALRQFVGTSLELEGYQVAYASDGLGILDRVSQEQPGLLIMDVVMPGQSGLDALRELRAAANCVPVVLLTARDDDEDKLAGFEAGADDYLVKPFNTRELNYRVAAVLRRSQALAPTQDEGVLTVGLLRLLPSQRAASVGERHVYLTRTEYTLLLTLARGAGRVFTPADLLSRVWGPEYRDQPEILRTNVYRLRHKLEDDPRRPKLLKTRAGVGYFLSPESD